MHLGFGKGHRYKHPERFREDSEPGPRNTLHYRQPLIFSAHYKSPLIHENINRFHGSEGGTFEVKASGDGLKAYGLLWIFNDKELKGIDAINHRQVCHILRRLTNAHQDFGRFVLGGGFLIADYDRRILFVFGASGDFGRCPDFVQLEMFRRVGYKIHLAGWGNEKGRPGPGNLVIARDWYLSHGIEIE